MITRKIEKLYIYPVKSLGGFGVDRAMIVDRGLQNDRRYMLVDTENEFLTQREHPNMALLKSEPAENGFRIRTSGPLPADEIFVPFSISSGESCSVTIWNDKCEAIRAGRETNDFFSRVLGMECSLVYMPESEKRKVNPEYAGDHSITAFSDGYPVLLMTSASLDDLNARLERSVGWDRFRPNVVIRNTIPLEEDHWKSIRLGGIPMNVVKPCSRCVLTTIDQQTGIASKEPLKTLATYRRMENHVNFGQNVVPQESGKYISIGDELVVEG